MAVLTATLADQAQRQTVARVVNLADAMTKVADDSGYPKPDRHAPKVKLVAGMVGVELNRHGKMVRNEPQPCVRVFHKGVCTFMFATMAEAAHFARTQGWKIIADNEPDWTAAYQPQRDRFALSGALASVAAKDDGTRFAPRCYVTDLDIEANDAMRHAFSLAAWKE